MFEKVNPMHPDKVADRIAGAIVDLAYSKVNDPKIAVEVLIGHGTCTVLIESSIEFEHEEIMPVIEKFFDDDENVLINYLVEAQDVHLNNNQKDGFKCGDNGIFKGMPLTEEEKELSRIARAIYREYPYDGKYILDNENGVFTICQSNAKTEELQNMYPEAVVNPLGDWTGGYNVDSGATNRKLGSDMAQSVTGGGLHGKDLSKADVSVNIYAFLKAQETGEPVALTCAIGDDFVDDRPYSEIVEIAREFINKLGGFEKFAEWGLF